jgi:hypothetical protein
MVEDVPSDRAPAAPIESYVNELATSQALPEAAIAACAERYEEAGPLLLAILHKATEGKVESETDERFLFRALHIIGGQRDHKALAPLLRLLQRDGEEVAWLLGDALTETLPRIVAGVFDGDADALFAAVAHQESDEVVRDSLLRAATFLTWDGRIERARTVAFLERFATGELAVWGEFVWNAWIDAIALLGLRHLEPLVRQVMKRNPLEDGLFERDAFYACLEEAERAPDDISRFSDMSLGYLDDVLEALQYFPDVDDDEVGDDEPDETDGGWLKSKAELFPQPVINPWRHVGRNDPCPCGSGKKAKRCCLAA